MSETGQDRVCVFLICSIDIVGSVEYKQNHPNWGTAFDQYFSMLNEEFLGSPPSGMEIVKWKRLGDDELYATQVFDLHNDFSELVEHHYISLKAVSDAVRRKFNEQLDVKGTMWIAVFDSSKEEQYNSATFDTRNFGWLSDQSIQPFDFNGRAIDEGFRVAEKFARPRRMALSFEVAVCISETRLRDRLYHLGQKPLKGIWRGRDYPAIWYLPEEDIENCPPPLKTNDPYTLHLLEKRVSARIIDSDIAYLRGQLSEEAQSHIAKLSNLLGFPWRSANVDRKRQ